MLFPEPESFLPEILKVGEEFEFSTFLLGVHLEGDISHKEKSALTRPLKIALGELLENVHWPERTVAFTRPELQIVIDVNHRERIKVMAAPIFLGGRYRKFSRRISSSHWAHMKCKGKGCSACGLKGFFADGSVGEMVGRPILASARGEKYFFHGMGREDVDARMLGDGRPFVVEIFQPRRRSFDLPALTGEINSKGSGLVEVTGVLANVSSDVVGTIKAAPAEKSYRAIVTTARDLPLDTARRVAGLRDVTIKQQTPLRVMPRRTDLQRRRKILWSYATVLDSRTFLWDVRAESGTYIKELASSDGGRTTPSLSEMLITPAFVVELDVVEIHYKAPWEND